MGHKMGYKVVLVGDAGVGKSALLMLHKTGVFARHYAPTPGIRVRSLDFQTNLGAVRFDCWDAPGDERLNDSLGGYCARGDGAIIMFDVGDASSHASVPRWCDRLARECPGIPVVLCGNKADTDDRQIPPPEAGVFPGRPRMQYCEMSTRDGRGIEGPFVWLARRLRRRPDLQFVETV